MALTLKLVIQKGPRQGETLEFTPSSTIRVGRVVKGNNLTIKDSGISSKHLQIEFNSTSMKWFITDLDSSNGTFLNSFEIKPFSPFAISHGDEIKIGELTAIRVEFVPIKDQISVRRNPRRHCGGNLSENVEIKEEIEVCRNPRKRGVCKNSGDDEGLTIEENVEVEQVVEKCKSSRKQGNENNELIEKNKNLRKQGGDKIAEGSELEENVEEVEERGRRGRGKGRPKKESYLKDGEYAGNAKLKQECGVSTRRTRSSKRREDELVSGVEAIPTRRTRSAKNVEVVMGKIGEIEDLDEDESKEVESVKVVENKKTRGVRGRKKKIDVDHLDKIQEDVLVKKNLEVSKGDVLEKVSDLSEQCCVELMVENDVDHSDEVQEEVLEKMNLEISKRDVRGKVSDLSEKHCVESMVENGNCSDVDHLDKVQEEVLEKMNLEASKRDVLEKVSDLIEQRYVESMVENDNCSDVNHLDEVQEEVLEKMNLEVSKRDVLDKVSDLIEQSCVESMVENDNCSDVDHLDKVQEEVSEKISLEMSKRDVLDKVSDLSEKCCVESIVEKDNFRAKNANEQHIRESIDEQNQNYDYVAGPSLVEKLGCVGVETCTMPDLEKMTVREWFDFLEDYLPKKIYEAGDEIIEDMRNQAKLFEDFILQHQRDKSLFES